MVKWTSFLGYTFVYMGFSGAELVKHLPAMWETWV